ncbi:MAG: hypothetical protein U1B94_01395 [candidate division NC10 bacterium]|nr:hypothetical protein [candidate division NC10 bacterium]
MEGERTLRDEVEGLVAKWGKVAVLAAAKDVARGARGRTIEATPDEKEQLAALFYPIHRRYPEATFNFFAFLNKQKRAGVPVKVSIEILDRIAKTKPDNPWALVETIMAQDYPGFSWGTRSGGPRRVAEKP